MIHYLETHSVDPFYNLAFEETVLLHRTRGDYLMLWQNDNTIVVGQNQNTEEEIDRAFVEAHHIRVVRRTTGGGAVYHDLGNLNYSFFTDAGDPSVLRFDRFAVPVAEALRQLGVNAYLSGRNDILVEGRKVCGTAQRLKGGRMLYHGCLLFDGNLSMVSGALRSDPEKFASKSTKSVRSRVTSIRPYLKTDMTLQEFWEYLKTALSAGGLVPEHLTEEELDQVETLKREKYDTFSWNYGRSPAYRLKNHRRFPGGTVEVGANVENGVLTDLTFTGDFLSLRPLEDLTAALRGCLYRREAVQAVLDRFPLPEYFGSITREEILDTLFHLTDSEGRTMPPDTPFEAVPGADGPEERPAARPDEQPLSGSQNSHLPQRGDG